MRKIALYIRVSTDEQAKVHEGSLVSQRQRLEEYVKARNLVEAGWGKVVASYVDERSAKDTKRPQFQDLIRAIELKKVDTVLVTELSRLSRSIRDFCVFWDFLKGNKAQFLSLREQFDTTTAAGEMMMFSIINFAQFERMQTSERVSANFQARASRGLYNGGLPPLGYDITPDKRGTLIVNENEAGQVRRIFEIFREKGSIPASIRQLKVEGITTKRHIRADGQFIGGHDWTLNSLWHVLRNRHYVAEREINKANRTLEKGDIPKGKDYRLAQASWLPVLSKELFEAVQEQLKANRSRYKPENNKTFDYIYSSLVFCPECSAPLVGTSGTGKMGTKYVYYAHKAKKVTCPLKRVDADELHQKIRARFKALGKHPALIEQLFADADANEASTMPDKDRRLQSIATELKDLNETVSNLLDQTEKLKSGASADRIHLRIQEKEARITVLSHEKENLSEDLSVSESQTVNAQELYEFAKKWDKNFAILTAPERKQFVRTYFGRIEPGPKQLRLWLNIDKQAVLTADAIMDLAINKKAKGAGPFGSTPFAFSSSTVNPTVSLYSFRNGGEGGIRTLVTR